MKNIKNNKTKIELSKIKFNGATDKTSDYVDLIESCLDIVPQGGFTPKDIRERNRIQDVIDKYRAQEDQEKDIELEDQDYEALSRIITTSRWASRDKELFQFLSLFEKS